MQKAKSAPLSTISGASALMQSRSSSKLSKPGSLSSFFSAGTDMMG